jgi:hypothetical protein
MALIGHHLPVESVLRNRRRHRDHPSPGSAPIPSPQRPTLEELLARGPLQPARALELLEQMAAAVEAAHARGIVHPDLQPACMLVDTARGEVALASHRAMRGPANGDASAVATLQYVSPEQILGRDAGPRSDVYSLSALLYHCVTGSVPFPRARDRAVLFWHLHAPRPRATNVRPDLPAAIDRVLARGMATDAAARHGTAHALIEDARQALSLDRPPTASAAEPTRSAGRRRALVPLGAVIALAAAAAGYALAGALDDPQPRPALARADRLELAAPADWRPLSASPAERSSLGLTDPLVLAPTQGGQNRLVAGTATAAASVALLSRLQASPASGERVALARVQARRYHADRPPGLDGPLTLYLAPMDRGIATIACVAERASAAASFMLRCERVAASLRLADGRSAPAGPSGRQATGLRRAFQRLNAARARYGSRAVRSRTAAGQATAARALARAHAREARALRSLELTGLAQPGGRAAIRSLQQAATAYRAVARAAIHRDPRGYSAARRSALMADASIRRALRALTVVGYAT